MMPSSSPLRARRVVVAALTQLLLFGAASARAADGCSTASFRVAPGYDLSVTTISTFAAADFDGDGKKDLAASMPAARSIAVLLNDYAEPLPCLRVEDATASEADANAVVTVRLSGPGTRPVKVGYQAGSYGALKGVDFQPAVGTLTFAPGETVKTLNVPIVSDAVDEEDESLRVYLSGAVGASVSDAAGAVKLTDDDAPPALSVEDVTAAEGNSSGTITFKVTLPGPSAKQITVKYATADGTANSAVGTTGDYFPAAGTLTFEPGVTSLNVNVGLRGDIVYEPDETFTLTLSEPTDATVADGQARATIRNDDGPGKFQFDSAAFSANESEPGALITVVRVGGATGAATVAYTASGGTATDGADYTAVTGTLSFAEGQTSKTFRGQGFRGRRVQPRLRADAVLRLPAPQPERPARLGLLRLPVLVG
jgi:chitinase